MKLRSGFRKLALESGDWQFVIGTRNAVIFSPDEKRYCVSFAELTGMTPDEVDRTFDKNRGVDHNANIRPSTIKKWILENT